MKKSAEIVKVSQENLQSKIYVVRGQRVMLDADLAAIYGYETRRFNEQVKNNIEKFESDFMFQLTSEEAENLMSKFSTSSWGGRRKLPYAFTEQGIYMLMTVLKGELATRQSKALIRVFKRMKDYIVENKDLLSNKLPISFLVEKNMLDIAELKNEIKNLATKEEIKTIQIDLEKVMDNFIDPDTYKHFLILDGQKIEAEIAYTKIYKSAKETVYVIDNYIGTETLEYLRAVKKNVAVTIFSDNSATKKLTKTSCDNFMAEYKTDICLKQLQNRCHDRYIVIDHGTDKEKIYHCGASSKDAGKKITTISRIDDTALYAPMLGFLLKMPELVLK